MVINNGASKASETKSTWRENGSAILEFLAYIAFILVLVVCIVGMVFIFITFFANSIGRQDDYSRIATEIKKTALFDSVSVETLINHLDTMVDIQKRSTANDLMAFIYGMLSSILVGLCGAFVLKSKRNAEEANKSAEAAKKNAEEANKSAEAAKKTAEEAKITASKSAGEIDEAKRMFVGQSNYQSNVFRIYQYIASAELEVQIYKLPVATDSINRINSEITKLLSSKDKFFDRESIVFLYEKLIKLQTAIENNIALLKKSIESREKSGGTDTTELKELRQRLQSMESLQPRYNRWLNESIAACEAALKTQS